MITRYLGFILILALASCSDNLNNAIKLVQETKSNNNTEESIYQQIAGRGGSIEWTACKSEKYTYDPDLVCVEVIVTRKIQNSKYKTIKVQYLANMKLKNFKVNAIELNGKPSRMFDYALAYQAMMRETLVAKR